MKRIPLGICSLCTILCLSAQQAQVPAQRPLPPLPEVDVPFTTERISVDGEMREAAWKQAPVLEMLFPFDSQTGAKQKTRVRLLWDDRKLYLLYECEDSDITAHFTQRDDPTYRDDAVEVFINPKPEQNELYIGFEMNARAVMYDYVYFQYRYLFKRLNLEGLELSTKIDGTLNARGDSDRGWTLEVAIPFSELEPLGKQPQPGERWTMNFNRWDGVEPARRLSMWSDAGLEAITPHNAKRFGLVRFVR